MTPEETALAQRRSLLKAEAELRNDLADAYGKAWLKIKGELHDLTAKIQEAQETGQLVDPGWLFQQHRLERFEREARVQLTLYLEFTRRRIVQAQIQALLSGQKDARTLLSETLPRTFLAAPALPVAQLENIISASRAGAPLGGLLSGLGARASLEARETLIAGVALGKGTREIGRELRQSFAGNGVRSLLVARTEVLRTYRDAAQVTYRRNPQVIESWVWVAKLDGRTCPVCIARHGSVHPLEEDFASHPGCRCAPAPRTVPWEALGVSAVQETRFQTESGEDWFRRQSIPLKRRILGPGKLRAYEDGEFRLDDLVQETVHPVWGRGLKERPLRDLLAA